MARVLSVAAERFPIAGVFTISRGSGTEAEVIFCAITQAEAPVAANACPIDTTARPWRASPPRSRACAAASSRRKPRELQRLLPAGAARNGLDCALWDLEAKTSGEGRRRVSGKPARDRHRLHAFAGHAGSDGGAARADAGRPLLKVKSAARATSSASGPS